VQVDGRSQRRDEQSGKQTLAHSQHQTKTGAGARTWRRPPKATR
jgi:hypothetical protein